MLCSTSKTRPLATKNQTKRTAPESSRVGAEEDPSAVKMVMIRPETTTSNDSTVQENTRATSASLATAADHKLQICTCGWRKVTSFRGLRSHQGKKGCLRGERQGPCIDYFLWKGSNQSNEAHQLDENHSLEGISTLVTEEANSSTTSGGSNITGGTHPNSPTCSRA